MKDMMALVNLDEAACRFTARRLRGERIYCAILPADTTLEAVRETEARGVIVCGGATGDAPDCPVIRELAEEKGGREVAQVYFSGDSRLLQDVGDGERLLRARRFFSLTGAQTLCLDGEEALGFRWGESLYGFAFQCETNDPDGTRLLINFSTAVCGCTPWWTPEAIVARAVEEIQQAADGGEALCLISGGVDSTVCAMLARIALGDRLTCLLIDTGLMREGEADAVYTFFTEDLGCRVRRIDAGREILSALAGITDRRDKVRTVFALIRSLTRHEISDMPEARLVLQGTNYSDLLGSDRPADLELTGARVRLLEPLRDLFKDEVRLLADEGLRLPEQVAQRQPFPGSGLALRVLGEVTPDRLALARSTDAIFREEIEGSGLNRKLWQYYTLLDHPCELEEAGQTVILRAIQVTGQSAALAARVPADLLERVTTRILSETQGAENVVYDLTPSTSYARTEWR